VFLCAAEQWDLVDLVKFSTAAAAWDKLAYTHRKEHVRSVVDAKRAETRPRRIAAVVAKLEGSD
jgi:uncharacterized protein YdeI (YjbR/CyaY-like superfamily)